MPKFIASGEYNDYSYLIIEKIRDNTLYSIWHTLSDSQRHNCIKQIANILRQINTHDAAFLDNKYKILDWKKHLTSNLKQISLELQKMNFNTSIIQNFIEYNLKNLFDENKFALVYNDAHFDNFIYYDNELKLIDFDRVIYCPVDYEMLIYKTMYDKPDKFANEYDEENIHEEDYAKIYTQIKEEYPEMFRHKKAEDRIKVYQFIYLIKQAIKTADHNWISSLLLDFKNSIL